MMKRQFEIRSLLVGLSILCLALGTSVVHAEDDDNDDPAEATIRLMSQVEAEVPEAVTKEISLPPAALENPRAVENAARGLERAQENRERRENGLSRADEARENGKERAEEARQNRENRGRFEGRRGPPDRPEPPAGPPGT